MSYAEFYTTSQDGLKLYARRWGPEAGPRLPVVCLPGLARTADDFDDVAAALAAGGDRAIYAFDYRGRGASDYDSNWKNYDLKIELADVLDQLTALGVAEAIFFGTSRGGLLTMLIAMMRPAAMRGAILNDIGPVINGKGLARIKSYVGKLPQPRSFEEGAAILRRIGDTQFPALDDAGWLTFARRTWRRTESGLAPCYDVNLTRTLELVDLEAPLPELWPQFDALGHVPLLVVRGAHSDILAPETAQAMVRRHPDARLFEAPFEGHAPLLMDAASHAAIAEFVARVDAGATPGGRAP